MTSPRSRCSLVPFALIAIVFGSSILAASAEPPDASLGELLALYRTYELPLPPDGAKLVRFESGWRSVDQKRKETPLDNLGFLIKPATANRPAVALVGTREITLPSTESKIMSVDPDPALAKDPTINEAEYLFGLNANLALALQCKSRGWDDLAQALLENRRVRVVIPVFGPGGGTFLPLRPSLAHTAWNHWENALVDPDTDRSRIAERMKALLAGEPSFTELNRQTFASLQATLEPSKARPGTIEAMIDDLVNLPGVGGLGSPRHPALVRLELSGFEAVPALIAHWDDPRLTRCAYPPVNNSTGSLVHVCDVVRPIIRDLAGTELATKAKVTQADVRAWWEKARQTGEESYLVARVLPVDENEEWANEVMLRIIGRRYPKHLPGFYQAILEKRPRMQTHALAQAVAESSLPRETKLELFRRAAEDPNLERRNVALWRLKELDPARFTAVLIATIDSLPRTPQQPYWKCPEAGIAHLVSGTDNPRVWAALEKAAKRSDVGLRMELISRMTRSSKGRRLRLEFLSLFLDDDTVRDSGSNPKLFDGPGAAFQIPTIGVRDFAAWQIGWILGMGVTPDANWTPEQWTQFRARVRQELEHELSREPEEAFR